MASSKQDSDWKFGTKICRHLKQKKSVNVERSTFRIKHYNEIIFPDYLASQRHFGYSTKRKL